MRRLTNRGFTIIELLISTVVFSLILLLITSAVIQFSKVYYKGIIVSRTQQTARNIVDDISGAIQYAGGSSYRLTADRLCVGSKRYSYIQNQQLGDVKKHVLVVDNNSECTSPYDLNDGSPLPPGANELMGEHMQLLYFKVDKDVGGVGAGLYRITVRIAYGQTVDMEDTVKLDGSAGSDGIPDSCKATRLGGQFCAISELSTIVARRTVNR